MYPLQIASLEYFGFNMKKINKILIANRGEIACRIIRTTQQLGITSVALYSDQDADSLAIRLADEAYYLGPSPAQLSYLNQNAIITIALQAKVDAIHPGYGFLSENADFAKLCEENHIIFIGPSSEVIAIMGDKHQAKTLMTQANIPVIPGYQGDDQTLETLYQQGITIGFPLMIKASAGGGGKGMRLVKKEQELKSALESAKREAKSSFDADELILERYIAGARHIEVQVLCDQHGNGWYLQDRECSIQRRHQKIIEEAPAPNIQTKIREKMAKTALDAAAAIHYTGAGTIEFLLDQDGQFYFMEMNTRLQVEHPVTEMICGIDMVAWQIYIAENKTLPSLSEIINPRGHAIEARLYAEDPSNQFMPDSGTVTHWQLPSPSPAQNIVTRLRIDTGVKLGDEISLYYDPLLAKLIAWGETRAQAIQRLQQALNRTFILGVKTNLSLLHRILTEPDFIEANIHTEFINEHPTVLASHESGQASPPMAVILAAGMSLWQHQQQQNNPTAHLLLNDIKELNSPWRMTDGWRANQDPSITILLWQNQPKDIQYTLQLQPMDLKFQNWQCRIDDQLYAMKMITTPESTETIEWIEWLCHPQTTSLSYSRENRKKEIGDHKNYESTHFTPSTANHFALHGQPELRDQTGSWQPIGPWQKDDFHSLVFNQEIIISYHGEVFTFLLHYPNQKKPTTHHQPASLTAPMPGIISQVCVTVGQQVQTGDPLMVLEAMKMEHTLHAPFAGAVSEIYFQVGDRVGHHETLIAISSCP